MIMQAVGRNTSALVSVLRHRVSVRTISITKAALGGGGHHHDPLPVYIPKPGSLDWHFCRNSSSSRASEPTPYTPGKDDYPSWFLAFALIGLTVSAVIFKTDTFSSKPHDTHCHGSAGKHSKSQESKAAEDAPSKPEGAKSVKPQQEESVSATVSTSKPESDAEDHTESAKPATSESAESKPSTSEKHTEEPLKETEEVHTAKDAPSKPEGTKSIKPVDEKAKPLGSGESNISNEGTKGDKGEVSVTTETNEGQKNQLHCEYVIIGSGTAAYYASLAIRAKKGEAKVLMIGEEDDLPYNRPPLSKELWWYGDETATEKLNYTALSGKKRDIFYELEGFFVKPDEIESAKHGGVSLIRGKKVTKICADDKKIMLDDGTLIGYDKVLIATGVRPKKEKLFDEASEEAKQKITYYHNPADFKRVERNLADKSVQKVTIVGNGILASELAYSIKRKYEDVEVHQVFEEKYSVEDILPKHLSKKSTEAVQKMGIKIHSEEKIGGVRKCCKNIVLKLKDGSDLRSDLVIVATGDQVNNEIAEASGLGLDEKNGGIKTDKSLRVGKGIWAAGGVASFEDSVLGTRRVNSWEHAQVSGRLAGENMATENENPEGKAFWYQPSFFTKFAPHLHINAIGKVDSSLDTVAVYAEPNSETEIEKAVVFYKSKETGNVVGVLLLNVFGPSLDVARRIIDDQKDIKDLKELAKLFPLYEMPKKEESVVEEKAEK